MGDGFLAKVVVWRFTQLNVLETNEVDVDLYIDIYTQMMVMTNDAR
jgi:hypothetical protein